MGGKKGDKGGDPGDRHGTPPGGHKPPPPSEDPKPDPANENPWDNKPIGGNTSWADRPEVTNRGNGWKIGD